jgi:hypothetical protein
MPDHIPFEGITMPGRVRVLGRSIGRFAAALLLCVAASGAFAAPITYTLSGLVSGTLGATPFASAQITITATGDTANIPDVTDCVPGPMFICNSLSSVTFTINGVGSGTITDGLFIFDTRDPSNPALGLERNGGSVGDWIDIDNAQFATYALATSIGPFTATTHVGSPFGTVATTAGVLALTSQPDVFQAVTAAAPSPPVIIKAFGAASIPVGGSTSLTFTIQNNNAATALTGVAFTDTFPAGLVVSTPNGLTGSCGAGTITAVAGSGSITLTGATLAAATQCTFSVNVTGTTAGVKNNTTGTVTSVEGGTGGTASASVTVVAVAPPVISKAFGAANIPMGGSTSLTFTIQNNNAATALTGVAFTDTFPAGLVVSTPNGLTGSCGAGTITATAGSGSITLTGATLAAATLCSFSVNVTGITAGLKINTTGAVTSVEGGTGGTATASVTVNGVGPPPPPATGIPTLQQWALGLLALLITIVTAGVTYLPRKRD